MKKFILLAFILVSSKGYSQLMDGKPSAFSHADSLRGMLSAERTCYDVVFYNLNIDLNIAEKFISGSNFIRFKVVNSFQKMQVDLFENMKIEKIEWHGKALKYKRDGNSVFINFPKKLEGGAVDEIEFYYSGNPIVAKRAPWDGGLVFKKDKAGNDWVGVACQGTGASLWWPTKDHQSDEPDSMNISITVPKDYMDVSNGRLRSKVAVGKDKMQYNWFVSNPINTYDVTLNIAKYEHFSDEHISADGSRLSLDYYVLPENLEKAKTQFQEVKPMMKIFEKHFGKYPFYEDGYKLVDAPYLGMEHQSAVAYGNKYQMGYLGMDLSMTGEGKKFDYIIIHESAHEWWGNSITTSDIADMWIHEGFGQYAETVYLEDAFGIESAFKYLNGLKRGVDNKEPIIGPYGVNTEGSGDMYPKGALLLNTLRGVINNDQLWWRIIYGVGTEFRHKIVNSEMIENYITTKSEMDLRPIFNQYLRNSKIPVLELRYTQKGDDLQIDYRWNADVKEFNMPADIGTPEGKKRIFPKTEFQSIVISKSKKENIKIDTGRFYIDVKEL